MKRSDISRRESEKLQLAYTKVLLSCLPHNWCTAVVLRIKDSLQESSQRHRSGDPFVANLCCVCSFLTFRVFISYISLYRYPLSPGTTTTLRMTSQISQHPSAGKQRMPERHYIPSCRQVTWVLRRQLCQRHDQYRDNTT